MQDEIQYTLKFIPKLNEEKLIACQSANKEIEFIVKCITLASTFNADAHLNVPEMGIGVVVIGEPNHSMNREKRINRLIPISHVLPNFDQPQVLAKLL